MRKRRFWWQQLIVGSQRLSNVGIPLIIPSMYEKSIFETNTMEHSQIVNILEGIS
jgi:hypothetical protein